MSTVVHTRVKARIWHPLPHLPLKMGSQIPSQEEPGHIWRDAYATRALKSSSCVREESVLRAAAPSRRKAYLAQSFTRHRLQYMYNMARAPELNCTREPGDTCANDDKSECDAWSYTPEMGDDESR